MHLGSSRDKPLAEQMMAQFIDNYKYYRASID